MSKILSYFLKDTNDARELEKILTLDLEKVTKRIKQEYKDTESLLTNLYYCFNLINNHIYSLYSLISFFNRKPLKNNSKNLLNNYKEKQNEILEMLESFSKRVMPEDYQEDLQLIEETLKSLGKTFKTSSYIYPIDASVCLVTVFKINERDNIVFSTVYSSKKEKFLNYMDCEILPGKYDLGSPFLDLKEKVTQYVKKDNNVFSFLIESSGIDSEKICLKIRPDINIRSAANIIKASFTDIINTVEINKDLVVLNLNKVKDKEIILIAKSLFLKQNEIHKLISNRVGV